MPDDKEQAADQDKAKADNAGRDDGKGQDDYAELKAAIEKERDARAAAEKEMKRLAKIVDDAEAAAKKREADEAAAKGEFEKLAAERQKEIDQLKADIAEKEREALKVKVGNAHKLPEPLIVLLQGDDEKALETHAKELAKHVKPPTAAETEAGAGTRTSNGTPTQQKTGTNAELAKANYSFMPAGAIPIPD